MARVRTALIVGGGIAGPVAAVALQKAGIEAAVYEAYADSAEGVRAFLGLGPTQQREPLRGERRGAGRGWRSSSLRCNEESP